MFAIIINLILSILMFTLATNSGSDYVMWVSGFCGGMAVCSIIRR